MTTLIAVYNSDGCVGRCDANCYLAASKRCTCICGGKNHRAGVQQAMENVAARVGLERGDLERYAAKHELKCEGLLVVDRTVIQDSRIAREHAYHKINQLDLFA